MTTGTALALVVPVLVVINVWVHVGSRWANMITGPLAALVLLVISRLAGLTWDQLGLGRQDLLRGTLYGLAGAIVVAAVYSLGVALPVTRRAFRDTRYQVGARAALYTSFVTIPLATVVFEEVAFRGVLWALLTEEFGVIVATVLSSALFGLWHVLPAIDLTRTNTAIRSGPAVDRSRVFLTVLGTVAFTTVAGVVFTELRRRSGSLVAPMGVHWAANGLGVLAAARVWAISSRQEGGGSGPR